MVAVPATEPGAYPLYAYLPVEEIAVLIAANRRVVGARTGTGDRTRISIRLVETSPQQFSYFVEYLDGRRDRPKFHSSARNAVWDFLRRLDDLGSGAISITVEDVS